MGRENKQSFSVKKGGSRNFETNHKPGKENVGTNEEEENDKQRRASTQEGPVFIYDILQLWRKMTHHEELYVSK